MHDHGVRSPAIAVREWRPHFPAGRIETIVLHWTAGDYDSVFAAYHFCIAGTHDPHISATCDLRANMRDVRTGDAPYAAHVAGRNSYAAGIAVCGMAGAVPSDFGAFALRETQLHALARVTAMVAAAYDVSLERIVTHAEIACLDGYFGWEGDDVRWDLGLLSPSGAPLTPANARAAGDELRARIAAAA